MLGDHSNILEASEDWLPLTGVECARSEYASLACNLMNDRFGNVSAPSLVCSCCINHA
jgi:hypothetical protein